MYVHNLRGCLSLGSISDFAELNTPPIISLGTIYPQALLIFLICLTFSVITPVILLFGTIYFGLGYLVYKVSSLFGRRGNTADPIDCSTSFFSFTSVHTNPADKLGLCLSFVSVGP